MCPSQKKRMYSSRDAAIRTALKFSTRHGGTPRRIYWHHQCKSFHLSSRALPSTRVR